MTTLVFCCLALLVWNSNDRENRMLDFYIQRRNHS